MQTQSVLFRGKKIVPLVPLINGLLFIHFFFAGKQLTLAPPRRGVRPVRVLRRVRAGLDRREDGGVANPVVVGGVMVAGGHGRLSDSGKQRCCWRIGMPALSAKIIIKKIWCNLFSLSYVPFFRAWFASSQEITFPRFFQNLGILDLKHFIRSTKFPLAAKFADFFLRSISEKANSAAVERMQCGDDGNWPWRIEKVRSSSTTSSLGAGNFP